MLAHVTAGTISGLIGIPVSVEVDVAGRGFPTFTIVGLPNKSIDEAKERVRTAISNAGYEMPDSRITVNLAPADIPKSGSGFDLAIALGILCASGVIDQSTLEGKMFLGELSLEGNVRKIAGIISLLLLAKDEDIHTLFIPQENSVEARLFEGLEIYPLTSLKELIDHLKKVKEIPLLVQDRNSDLQEVAILHDFSEIKGQTQAKRALEIAAAGFHNVHLRGVPGAGKTLLSRSFSSILPRLSSSEILEVAKIYSAIGEIKEDIFYGSRPFRAPHHTTSRVGLIGGGSPAMPGEISLAHRGVLFLDEFPEYPRSVLESLRQPLEDGEVTISRASGSVDYPARFLLLAASNPCPCGYLGHPKKKCVCSPGSIIRYKKRLSGPLLDRIDIHIDVPPVDVTELTGQQNEEKSSEILKRVKAARVMQEERFKEKHIQFNSEMKSADIYECCLMEKEARDFEQYFKTGSGKSFAYKRLIPAALAKDFEEGRTGSPKSKGT
jgi:magnesium chelatase family protein